MPRDPNTLSNYDKWKVTHTIAELSIDFSAQKLHGSITHTAKCINSSSQEVVLDTSFLEIQNIYLDNIQTNDWKLQERVEIYGSALTIKIPDVHAERQYTIRISFSTTDKCTALQWLTPTQTFNKKHPYVFSQCQPIHCRSLFPCQDTPDSKSTYDFIINSPLPTIVSGLPIEGLAAGSKDCKEDSVFRFRQEIPISSYLFAIVSGDIVSASIGPRSTVATGPEQLAGCKWELEEDIENFIQVAEKLIFPYVWTTFSILVLPPSFPYGGMENPNFTFATPTTISGDKSSLKVFAHELAHSWSGNLVTNASWEHFWLNEGWTKYLERRILADLYGEDYAELAAVIGWKALEDAVGFLGEEHEFTKLVVDLKGKDPDDSFSQVPYEKGYHFFRHLDKLVGRLEFDNFVKHYFIKWQKQSLDSDEFKSTVKKFFETEGAPNATKAIANLDWDTWFHSPGLPPKPDFNMDQANQCYDLARKWESENGFTPNATDIKGWSIPQLTIFLERIQLFATPLSPTVFQLLGRTYSLSSATTKNADLLFCYFMIGLKAKDREIVSAVATFLGNVGRMKFVRPLYRELGKLDKEIAVRCLEENGGFYHPICRSMVEKDLGLLRS